MGLAAFLRQLSESGHVRVGTLSEPETRELSEAEAVLLEWDAAARLALAFEPPPFVADAALWAAVQFYRGCQFLVFREVDADILRDALRRPCPQAASPAVCYSVDLPFRYLPDLLTLARGASENDPLVAELKELARAWPLSSVGARDIGAADVSPFWESASLRRLYVDRILAKHDAARLQNEQVRDAVRAAWGLYPELGGPLAALVEASKPS